jgi:hypothetical protein
VDPYQKIPYSYQWNLGFQRMLGGNTVLTLNYVGSASSRLDIGGTYNTATPGPGDQAPRRPFPNISSTHWDRPWGRATYHALQSSLERKTGSGFSYLLSYTWGKSIDVPCSGYFSEDCTIQDPNNFNNDKAVSGYDLTHIFSFSWVYTSPFGRGQRWSTGSRALDYLMGNWRLNGITSLHSGQPYHMAISGDIANTGNQGLYERLNLTGKPVFPANQTPEHWINTDAFAVPAPFTFGNEGRNAFRTDWGRNLDLSLFRDFPITESKRLQFRFEAFNIFNTPQFGTPDRNYANPTFGQITYTSNVERQIQFALKFYF